jgi:ribonuclease P protein component
LGVSTARSCGTAVSRNRLKRIVREVFRRNQARLPAGLDYVLVISASRAGDGPKSLTLSQAQSMFLAQAASAAEKLSGGAGRDCD